MAPKADTSSAVAPSSASGHEGGNVRRRRRRRIVVLGAVLLVVVIGLVACTAIVMTRLSRVDIRATDTSAGVTYLVIGSDSRERTPSGLGNFGDKQKFAGARADVILLVHRSPNGETHTVSVPRDIIVQRDDLSPTRLALTLLDGPQQTVNALCRTLKIGVDHVVVIDGAGVTDTVNALGGVTVTLEHPVRDAKAFLDLPAGELRLDGTQALALVRARHPEQKIGGSWQKADEATGAAWRSAWSATVFTALQEQFGSADPLTQGKVAWTLSENVAVDEATGPGELVELARSVSSPATLPVQHLGGLAVSADSSTREAIRAAGLDTGCRLPG
ncbi:LCP family protein [Propionicicella superfundia]|uniref:LCP family protein n=1 Tax=Propionicicella superfundia TaxID=348582 RepID=UPI00040CD77C|nr:LCP family protein [Propionicicella superfundia]